VDWNPIHWLKAALGDVKGPLGAIETWVLKRIAQAGGLIENDVHKLTSAIWSHLSGVKNTLSFLAGEINTLADRAGKDLSGDLGKLVKDAEGWLHDAESYADSAVSTFDRDVLDPALSGLRRAIHDVEAAPDKVWHDWLNDVWKPADKVIHDAEVDAHSALHWVDHEGHDIKVLLDKCWDWLEWLGASSIHDVESLPHKMLSELTTTKLEEHAAEAVSGWGGLLKELDKELPGE